MCGCLLAPDSLIMAVTLSCLTVSLIALSQVSLGATWLDPEFNFTEQPQDTIALRNKEAYLYCHASGEGVTYTWRKDGDDIESGRRFFTVLQNGTLYIKKVVYRKQRPSSHEGVYECLAWQHEHALLSRKARLQVATLSRLSGDSREVTAAVGEVVRFSCTCHAVPRPTYTWHHNDRQVTLNDTRYTMLDSGVLIIRGVDLEDDGIVKCEVKNIAKEEGRMREIRLNVREETSRKAMRLLSQQLHLKPKLGETAVMECTATGLPLPNVSWVYENGSTVQESGRVTVHHGILTIRDLQRTDSRQYVCVAEQPGNSAQKHSVQLDVYEPPRMLNFHPKEFRELGNTIRISCNFTGGYPLAETVSWYKDGKLENPNRNGRFKVRSNGLGEVFVINNADIKDIGYYMCRMENEAGAAQHTIAVDIKRNANTPGKPRNLRAETLSSTSIRLNWDNAQLKTGQSFVAYSVHLQKVGNFLEKQRVSSRSSLDIDDLDPNSNYSFYVVTYFSSGPGPHSDKVYQQTYEDKPIAFPEVQVEAPGAMSLKVRWNTLSKDEARGKITKYHLLYREHNHLSTNLEELPGDQNDYLILGLLPDTAYDIRVKAGTRAGFPSLPDSDWPWVTARTLADLPSLGVPKMRLTVLNSTAVKVMWDGQPPANMVAWKLTFSDAKNEKYINFQKDVREHIMTSLWHNTRYEVRLQMVLTDGDSEPVVEYITTPKDTGLSSPEGLKAHPFNASTIMLIWQYPAQEEGAVSYYTVRYMPATGHTRTGSSTDYRFIRSQTEQVFISGLEPYTYYELAVQAQVGDTASPYSKKIQCRTNASLPGSPRQLQVLLKSTDAVMIHWDPPPQTQGTIVKYRVLICQNNDAPEEEWTVKTLNGTETNYLLEDLNVGTYYIKVQAVTETGVGPATAMQQVHIQDTASNQPPTPPPPSHYNKDMELGIIIAAVIIGACILACILIILCRNRCCPRESPDISTIQAECIQRVNGNGYVPTGHGPLHNESHEMDSFTPMLTHIPENANSDSKGRYGMYDSPHGVRICANYMPNGHVTTILTNQHLGNTDTNGSPQNPRNNSTMLNCDQQACSPQPPTCHNNASRQPGNNQSSDTEGEGEGEDGPPTEASPLNPSSREENSPPTPPSPPPPPAKTQHIPTSSCVNPPPSQPPQAAVLSPRQEPHRTASSSQTC